MKILENGNKYIKAHVNDIVKQKLGLSVTDFKFIGGGSYGKVYKLTLSDSREVAFKAYRQQGDQYAEKYQLDILGENTSVKMPKPLFTYEDENTAVLCMEFVEGKNTLDPSFLLKSKKQKKEFRESVITGILQWHSVTGEKFGELENPLYESWKEYYIKELQTPWLKGLEELADKGKFSRKSLKLLLEATEIFNSLPEEKACPVLIHSDLNIMNIMAAPDSMKLTAFIDPCSAKWADREYDLFQLRNMWGDAFGLYDEYKRRSEMSEFTDFRVAYYGAMNEAHCRLGGGLIMPLWEVLNNRRLKKEMKIIKH